MRVGMVQLLDMNENIIRYASYDCKTGRRNIIAMWQREYANRLNGCSILISPYDKYVDKSVNEKTGMNFRKIIKKEEKSKISQIAILNKTKSCPF